MKKFTPKVYKNPNQFDWPDNVLHFNTPILEFPNHGDDAINAGDFVHICPTCDQVHGVNSDCKQGQRA